MSWKEEIKKSRAYDVEGFKEFTDTLIKLERALREIQDIDDILQEGGGYHIGHNRIIFDSISEAEVAIKNAIQYVEKRFEQYKRELKR
mgnify:CR=1 FL=1